MSGMVSNTRGTISSQYSCRVTGMDLIYRYSTLLYENVGKL